MSAKGVRLISTSNPPVRSARSNPRWVNKAPQSLLIAAARGCSVHKTSGYRHSEDVKRTAEEEKSTQEVK